MFERRVIALPVIFACVLVAACANTPPYIDRPYEINREDTNFPLGPDVTDGVEFNVCYNVNNATRDGIIALAQEECDKGGLVATFVERRIDRCPMVTPSAAVFQCQASVAGGTLSTGSDRQTNNLIPSTQPAPVGSSFGERRGLSAADVSTSAKSEPFPTFLFSDPASER